MKRTVHHIDRNIKALELRRAGHTYDAIAHALGYHDRSAARKAIQREISSCVAENVDELRALHQATLDDIWRLLWPMVFERKRPSLHAIDRLLRVMDQSAKLWGLYKSAPGYQVTSGKQTIVIVQEVEAAIYTGVFPPKASPLQGRKE